jgi:carbonic anhydrase
MQLRRVAAIPIVEAAWARGETLHLHGWLYGMHDGLLRDLGPTVTSLADRDALSTIDQRVFEPVDPSTGVRRHALAAFAALDDAAPAAAGGTSSADRPKP